MTTKRPISWFLTEKGRKLSFALVAGSGVALTLVKFTPNTFGIKKYKEFVHNYSNGQPLPLSRELQDRYNKCLDIIKIPEIHKKIFTPFNVFGFDLFNAGTWQSRFGALIGIPVHFSYESVVDIPKDLIQVNHKSIDWESETGKKLADSLVLPDKVKDFAICREILATQNNKVFIQSAYPFMCVFLVFRLSSYLNGRLNLYVAPTPIRSILYSLTGMFGLGLYLLLNDYTEVYYETVVDKKLCEIDPEFIQCGAIFYDKIMKRNQALRELMGKEGESKYSKLGNENFGFRQPRITLMHRKQFFESKLKGDDDENVS